VLGIAASAVAVPVAFSEDVEAYTPPAAPGGVWSADTHFGGGLITAGTLSTIIPPQGSAALKVSGTNYGIGSYGMGTSLVGADQGISATDASRLVLTYLTKLQHCRYADFFIELSLGDVHAPAFTTVPQTNTIPVIGFGKPYLEATLNAEKGIAFATSAATQMSFFDGKNWKTPGGSANGSVWTNGIALTKTAATSGAGLIPEQVSMSVGTASVILDTNLHANATDIAYTVNREYTGNFDRMNVYTRFGNVGGRWVMLDSISLTGGDIVPEPAALLLLVIGGIVMLSNQPRP
jgi:hypothetical protein